jgi:hypothetical protein
LQKKPKAAMEQPWHSCTVRLITHESKIVVMVFISICRRLEKEIEDIIGDDQFDLKDKEELEMSE